jgi:hypothetical protein
VAAAQRFAEGRLRILRSGQPLEQLGERVEIDRLLDALRGAEVESALPRLLGR